MSHLRIFLARCARFFAAAAGRDAGDAELREELEHHLAQQTAENIRRGMDPVAARQSALLSSGGMVAAEEAVRERRSISWADNALTDLRYALRSLRLNPGFSGAVVLTLALGIGANAAMFTIVNAVVLRSLPYPASERIVSLSTISNGVDQRVVDDRTFETWLQSSRSFQALAVFSTSSAVLDAQGKAQDVLSESVSAAYFDVLGIQPYRGRTFTSDEDRRGAAPVGVMSEQLWRNTFGADPNIVGKSILLNGTQTTVVGVMPAIFTTPLGPQLWRPYKRRPVDGGGGGGGGATFYYQVIGRLRAGATAQSARAELDALSRRLETQRAPQWRGLAAVVMTLHDRRFGDSRKPLLLLFAAVGVLLLIACANLANLSLARTLRRQREFALRLALGAQRGRLASYVLFESLILSLAGGALGILLASASVGYFARMSPSSIGNIEAIRIDSRVLLFTLIIAVATGVAFGLIPALSAGRGNLNRTLSTDGPRASGGRGHRLVRRLLVISELATALVLLTGAGLVARTFWKVTAIDPGFDPQYLMAAAIHLPRARYGTGEAAATFYDQLLKRLRETPSIQSLALANVAPLSGVAMSTTTTDKAGKKSPLFDVIAVGPGYFETLHMHMVEGRPIGPEDRKNAPGVVVVSSALAHALFPDSPAVGQTIAGGDSSLTIIGVVDVAHQRTLEGSAGLLALTAIAQDDVSPW